MLFAERNFRLQDGFRRVATGSYKAGAGELDFRSNPEGSRAVINRWTEQYTEGRIKELFEPGIITEETVLVLANAIYFKAGWFKPFQTEDTRLQPFYVSDRSLINVPTMFGMFQMYYGEIPALDAKAVKLEYNEDNMDMTILVPNTPSGLSRLEAGLGQLNLADLTPEYAEVHLSIPKFKIESNHRLKGKLEQLGIVDVFTLAADLSNMADPGLYVSDIVQKTFIGVDENGTEAAVATGQNFFLRTSFARRYVKADRPFLFLIHRKNVTLFMGRVVQPGS
ncbi:Serine protease inhibitor 77Ba [Gryllus bimaculatus]|nr:Serine protease inhibitor 77Ba [Gryllus bimaculatus]